MEKSSEWWRMIQSEPRGGKKACGQTCGPKPSISGIIRHFSRLTGRVLLMCGGPVWHHGALACAWARSAVGKVLRYVGGMWTQCQRNSARDLIALLFLSPQGSCQWASMSTSSLWAQGRAPCCSMTSELRGSWKRSSQLVNGSKPKPRREPETKQLAKAGWWVSSGLTWLLASDRKVVSYIPTY